jgi:hypothetical protein
VLHEPKKNNLAWLKKDNFFLGGVFPLFGNDTLKWFFGLFD